MSLQRDRFQRTLDRHPHAIESMDRSYGPDAVALRKANRRASESNAAECSAYFAGLEAASHSTSMTQDKVLGWIKRTILASTVDSSCGEPWLTLRVKVFPSS